MAAITSPSPVALLWLARLVIVCGLATSGGCARFVGSLPGAASDGGAVDGAADGDTASDGDASGAAGDGARGELMVVLPAYATAPGWMDHVRRSEPLKPHYAQPGVACDAASAGVAGACVHAGELRRVRTSLPSCAGLQVKDELDALRWRCELEHGAAVLYSTGLREGVGLGALLLPSAFRQNRVEVRAEDGALLAASERAVWWNNPVKPLPPSEGATPVTIAEEGTIYTVGSDTTSSGHHVDADRVAVVVLPGVTLSAEGVGDNCLLPSASGLNHRCLLSVAARDFFWLEGWLSNGGGGAYALLASGARALRLRQARAAGFWHTGFSLKDVGAARLEGVVASNNGHHGIRLDGSVGAVLSRVTVTSNGRTGTNPGDSGVILERARHSVITRLTTASNEAVGLFFFDGSRDNTAGFITAALNTTAGVVIAGDGGDTLFQLLALRAEPNAGAGLLVRSAGNRLAGGAFGHQDAGLRFEGAGAAELSGRVVLSAQGADCRQPPTTSPCDALGAATVSRVAGFENAVRGKVTADDVANASDVAGGGSFATIDDWLSFETRHRGWGADGAAFANADNVGLCAAACRIWDWRLGADGDLLLGGDAPALEAVRSAEPCPAAVAGDRAIDDGHGNTFLIHAGELLGDALGDDDGLCESNEACVYRPHIGDAQRGESAGSASCVFADGAVSNVTIVGLVS